MLSEERLDIIEEYVTNHKSASIAELALYMNTSESTVRRDLFELDKAGRIAKVHGGARAVKSEYKTFDHSVLERMNIEIDAKKSIGRLAASLIEVNDTVYLDAGTSVGYMVEYIPADFKGLFVTNYIAHAKILSSRGFNVVVIGGELKIKTEAFVGSYAVESLKKFNFTKGFFGANGIGIDSGYSTPDLREGVVKGEAMSRCAKAYVLADSTKFDNVSPISFGTLAQAEIITDKVQPLYEGVVKIKYAQ